MIWDIGDVASSRTLTDCQGGSLEACVGACPSSSFAACVESCATRCSDAPTPSPTQPTPSPTPSPTPQPTPSPDIGDVASSLNLTDCQSGGSHLYYACVDWNDPHA